jgi:lipoprotein-anchoring transpeptidase ErfK/SrfK
MTPLGVVVAALAVLGAPMPGAGQDAATSPAPAAPTASTAWTARVLYPVPARSAPSVTARIRSRLDSVTAYWRRPQGLLVLSDIRTDGAGREWVQVRLPTRPNRASGWVPRRAVALTLTRTRIRVLVSERRVELWRDGRRVRSFPAAVGTGSTPTPAGLFAVQDPVPSVGAQRGYLGPYIVTLTAYSPVLRTFMGGNGLVAIHGTNAPGLLGRAVSHGCIRVSNDAIRRLYRVSAPGTPVEILA